MKTPLHLEISPNEHVIVDTSGARLADVRGFDGDPDEIVRRCNAFDELITALKNFMEWEDPFWDSGEWIEQLIAKYEVPSTENEA